MNSSKDGFFYEAVRIIDKCRPRGGPDPDGPDNSLRKITLLDILAIRTQLCNI